MKKFFKYILLILLILNLLTLNIFVSFATNDEIISAEEVTPKLDNMGFKLKTVEFEQKLEKFKTLDPKPLIEKGTYAIKTVLNTKYSLGIETVSSQNESNIQLYEYVKENKQRFKIEYTEDGCYTIISVKSGKALTVEETKNTSVVNVYQNEFNNSDSQKWIIEDAGDGSYNIISKYNDLYLTVSGGIANNNVNIQVEIENGTNAQKFKFEKNNISYEKGIYGKSGLAIKGDVRGTNLEYYKIGQGENVLFTTFSIHGFEDSYDHDGKELTYIAEQFKTHLLNRTNTELFNKWTIYILPMLNPDGQIYGWTNNGEGRTTLYSSAPNNKGIDMNRNFQSSGDSYPKYTDNRNYNGTEAFQAYEARYLRYFLLSNKSTNGQTVLIDLHGWLNETIGDYDIGTFYRNEFGMTKHIYTYGQGYLVNWARQSLGNSNKVARSSLVELPEVSSHEQLLNEKHADKYINATIKMLESII